MKKRYCFDLDGTLCTSCLDPRKAEPIQPHIDQVNQLYADGHTIIIDTARGSITGVDWRAVTHNQLTDWGIQHHEFRTGIKTSADLYIDDRCMEVWDFFGTNNSKRPPTIYIAGPMRGYPDLNFPAFFKKEKELLEAGWIVVNPARLDSERDTPPQLEMYETDETEFMRLALKRDLGLICSLCTDICMLDGWETSAGAKTERELAKALNQTIYYGEALCAPPLIKKSSTIGSTSD